jgi:hypothetical protein
MITIKPNELEAVAFASSYEQTRYYLNGVCVETYADGTSGLIATDGHRLHAIAANKQEQPVSSFILGNNAIEKALKLAKSEKTKWNVTIEITDQTLQAVMRDKQGELIEIIGSFDFKPVYGNFPDWRRVIPSMPADNVENDIAFNCAYMADFGKVAKLLTGLKTSRIKLTSTGRTNPILVNVNYDAFTGVLMPMRF